VPLTAIDLPPGSGRRATPQQTRGWWDMSLVRWDGAELVPIGGWKPLPGMQLDGSVRSLISWRDNGRVRWVAAATLGQIQVWDGAIGHVINPADFVAGSGAGLLDGYGIGDYGRDAYGVHRSIEGEQFRGAAGDSLSLDNWGEDLVMMGSADGRLMMWTPVLPVATLAQPVAGAPRGTAAIVTEERHIMVLGADGDPRRLSWCSQELPTDWVATDTNTAGSLQLRSTGVGLSMRRVAQGVMVWCDDDVHLASYIGTPYVYGLQRIGAGCGAVGPEAMCAMSGRAVWFGQGHNFWLYDGAVRPLPCPLADYLAVDMNPVTKGNTYAYHNGVFPEVTWGYPSVNAVNPDSYITWNYETNLWWHGRIERTIGCEPGAFGLPLMGDASGIVYQHETGWMANGVPRGPAIFCETGDIQLGEGDRAVFVGSMVPDMRRPELVQFQIKGSWEPHDQLEDFGTFVLERNDGLIDLPMIEARALRLRIEGLTDGPWALGRIRLDVRKGAGR
jgi:hypothetical protein